MKKVICIILITIICLNFSSCNFSDNKDNDTKLINDQAKEIVRCFDEKDIDGLKSLFCQNTQDNYNLDEEIQDAFDLYEGKSESFNVNLQGGWAGGKDNGEWTDKHFTPQIENIKTDKKETYSIGYLVYYVYSSDPGRVGICALGLRNGNGEEIARIGGR